MKIGVIGCSGKVGTQIVKTLYYTYPAFLGACLTRPGSEWVGKDVGELINVSPIGLTITDKVAEVFGNCDVLIDFTNHNTSINNVKQAVKYNKPIVIGTTGFTSEQEDIIQQSSKKIPIFKSANMSLGVNVLYRIVEYAASILSSDLYDIEIVEKHHKSKKDAPSGTALALGNIIAKLYNSDLKNLTHSIRKGISQGREPNKIGFSVIRGGDTIGEHSVLFMGEGEVLELKHVSNSRAIFVQGAIKAATWIVNQKKGFYLFSDIINSLYDKNNKSK